MDFSEKEVIWGLVVGMICLISITLYWWIKGGII